MARQIYRLYSVYIWSTAFFPRAQPFGPSKLGFCWEFNGCVNTQSNRQVLFSLLERVARLNEPTPPFFFSQGFTVRSGDMMQRCRARGGFILRYTTYPYPEAWQSEPTEWLPGVLYLSLFFFLLSSKPKPLGIKKSKSQICWSLTAIDNEAKIWRGNIITGSGRRADEDSCNIISDYHMYVHSLTTPGGSVPAYP